MQIHSRSYSLSEEFKNYKIFLSNDPASAPISLLPAVSTPSVARIKKKRKGAKRDKSDVEESRIKVYSRRPPAFRGVRECLSIHTSPAIRAARITNSISNFEINIEIELTVSITSSVTPLHFQDRVFLDLVYPSLFT